MFKSLSGRSLEKEIKQCTPVFCLSTLRTDGVAGLQSMRVSKEHDIDLYFCGSVYSASLLKIKKCFEADWEIFELANNGKTVLNLL